MVSIALIGAGDRALKYSEFIRRNPTQARMVAVAEPNEVRRNKIATLMGIDAHYDSWEQMLREPRLCDAVIIATPDHLHYEPTMAALKKGYHVLLEKPIAQTIEQCNDICSLAKELNLIVGVCHVLRYFPSYMRVKELITKGSIGEIMSINHREPVGIERMTHAFVRGIWNSESRSNPMILAKACHDLDLIVWLTDDTCRSMNSYGSLRWFKSENAPAGSTDRCDSCPLECECPFSAVNLYIRRKKWLRHFDKTDEEYIKDQLSEGDYGRCVYRCDNTVVDNQVVSMLMNRGAIVNFSMDAFTTDSERTTHIMGSRGEIKACEHYFEHIDFKTRAVLREDFSHLSGENSFHSGADIAIVADFVNSIADRTTFVAHINSSIESHRIAFEAERIRLLNAKETFNN